MKYRVTITQRIKYTNTLTGTFTSLAVAQHFIELVVKHFEKSEITIEVITEEDQEETEE